MRVKAFSYSSCVVVLLFSAGVPSCAIAQTGLKEGLAALAEGSYERAASLLSRFSKENPDHPSSAEAMIGSGQALAKAGKHRQALEVFRNLLVKNQGTRLETPLRLVCAKTMLSTGQFPEAIDHCRAVTKQAEGKNVSVAYGMMITALCEDSRSEEALHVLQQGVESNRLNIELAEKLACYIGSHALKHGSAATASEAYGWHLKQNARDQDEAAIGYAWAQASLASDKSSSAKALTDFVDAHPSSPGAPRALLAASRKLLEIDKRREAADILERLAWNYPSSEEAAEALAALSDTADKLGDVELARKARSRLASRHFGQPVGQRFLHQVIADAVRGGNAQDVQQVAASIFSNSESLKDLPQTLSIVAQQSGQELANEFSKQLLQRLAEPKHHDATAPVVRWLFDRSQWNVIAEAAGEFPASLLVHDMEQGRLIAESMLRAGIREKAYETYGLLARKDNVPFIVMLRTSELAVQIGDIETAAAAVARAEKHAGSTRDKQYVSIVAAQLSLRRAEFDIARQELQTVVRSPASDAKLRGRAQWLIGETHFMQQDYPAAIEAYRKCETLFPESVWAPAALLQAGKAFEKLGRFREAGICYKNLLKKHDDSSHARLATSRLAAIQGTIVR